MHLKQFDRLDEFSTRGWELLEETDATRAVEDFRRWVSEVSTWLSNRFPATGLVADWLGLSEYTYVLGQGLSDTRNAWETYHVWVRRRIQWLTNLPQQAKLKRLVAPAAIQNKAQVIGRREVRVRATARAYVDPGRIEELKSIEATHCDMTKLVRLCEEINVCFAGECYLALIMMTRAILDHVPPIFRCRTFAEIANNHAGSRSFKEAMSHLETTSRKIADHYLHGQIRESEVIPNATQVDFSNSLDFLLSEIVRILK